LRFVANYSSKHRASPIKSFNGFRRLRNISYYDNLKVARNAPVEVIGASYTALIQKYHLDKNPDDADSVRIMNVLRQSYEVLSDPVRRAAHDKWIASREIELHPRLAIPPNPPAFMPLPSPQPSIPQAHTTTPIVAFIAHVFSYWILYAGLAVWVWYANTEHEASTPTMQAVPVAAAPAANTTSKLRYVRPTTAPNGTAWPLQVAYFSRHPIFSVGGLSSVTIDNSINDADVHVKLILIHEGTALISAPAREFFIPAGQQMKLVNVSAATYDVRYRDLNSGALAGSEPFTLVERSTYNGTEFSNLTMTLYKVRDGNMQTHSLDEGDF
jgi:hypothetical protein